MKTIISINDLRVVLGKDVLVLDGINLELGGGRIIGLIGPSGSGKTTFLRALVGMIVPTNGSVSVFGEAPGSSKLLNKVAYMTQELSVYPDLTVRQNLIYFGRIYGSHSKKKLESKINQILGRLELRDKEDVLVRDLSGGQKQRVSLAICLLGKHKLLILDEPTTGLDPVLKVKLWKLFKELKDSGVSIIISSHAMDEASKCDDIILLRDGQVIANDTPTKILKATKTKTVEKAFLKLVGGAK